MEWRSSELAEDSSGNAAKDHAGEYRESRRWHWASFYETEKTSSPTAATATAITIKSQSQQQQYQPSAAATAAAATTNTATSFHSTVNNIYSINFLVLLLVFSLLYTFKIYFAEVFSWKLRVVNIQINVKRKTESSRTVPATHAYPWSPPSKFHLLDDVAWRCWRLQTPWMQYQWHTWSHSRLFTVALVAWT